MDKCSKDFETFDDFQRDILFGEGANEWSKEDSNFKKKHNGICYSSRDFSMPSTTDRRILYILRKYHEWVNGGSE